jgi:hypothetical protein
VYDPSLTVGGHMEGVDPGPGRVISMGYALARGRFAEKS